MAKRADLADALTRLHGCGADGELVALARVCLAADKAERPRDGNAVAGAVAAHRQEVQRRLKAAEIEAAAEAARAEEEKKLRVAEVRRVQAERQRRRIAVALAAAVVLLVLGASGAVLVYQNERGRQEAEQLRQEAEQEAARQQQKAAREIRAANLNREVRSALADAETGSQDLRTYLGHPQRSHALLSELPRWEAKLQLMEAAWQRGATLRAGGDNLLDADAAAQLDRLRKRLDGERAAFRLAKALDDVLQLAARRVGGRFDLPPALKKYHEVLAGAGLDVTRGDPAALAARIEASPARYALVAALDHWASFLAGKHVKEEEPEATRALQGRLLEIARRADPDPWRDRFRDLTVWGDVVRLRQLAAEPGVEQQPPQLLLALARRLNVHEWDTVAMLRKAVVEHPRDFWLYFELGNYVKDEGAQAGCYQAALAIRPENALAHNNLGACLFHARQVGAAVAHFRKAVANDPGYALAHANLAGALFELKQWDGAIVHYRNALDLGTEGTLIHFRLGAALYHRKNLDEALVHLNRALAIDPKHALSHNGLGRVLEEQGNRPEALKHYREAIRLDENLADAHNNLGVALRDGGQTEEALLHYRKAVAIDPRFARAHYNIGVALNKDRRDPEGAAAAYRAAIASDPDLGEAHYNLGLLLHDGKDAKGAIVHFRKAAELLHGKAQALALNNLGSALRKDGDEQGAVDCFRKAIAAHPDLPQPYCNLAIGMMDRGQTRDAIDHYRKAIDRSPHYMEAHHNLGMCLMRVKDLPGAVTHLRKAAALAPDHKMVHFSLGVALFDSKDIEGSLTPYRRAVEIDPGFATGHFNLGVALRELGDADGAAAHFRIASAIEPDDWEFHYNLGVVLRAKRDLGGAAFHFREAVALNPRNFQTWGALGNALLQQGEFADAYKATVISVKMLPANHPSQKAGLQQLRQCEALLNVDRKLSVYLDKGEAPGEARGLLELIELCRRFKQYHATAARLYALTFTAVPALAEDLETGHRHRAAGAALLAAAGRGRDPGKLSAEDQAGLRAQALGWVQADLQQWTKRLQARDLKALTELFPRLADWQQDAAFALVRAGAARDGLPADEQKEWQQLGADVGRLRKQVAADVRTVSHKGTLTPKVLQRVYQVKMQAGEVYLIDLESGAFDTLLRVHDGQGKLLAENDDIAYPANLNSRLLFTAPADGTYRLVATSFEQRGTGAYTLTMRSFAAAKQ
jgi:tetratricopeptide (TPR) repeat protein